MSFRGLLEIVCRTDTGLLRAHNEDSLDSDSALGAAILADGMGGYQAGEVASEIAVRETLAALRSALGLAKGAGLRLPKGDGPAARLRDAVEQANRAIFESAAHQPAYQGMGTTLVAALFHGETLALAHVGDSRAYRLRQGKLERLTKDHSVAQALIDQQVCSAEETRFLPNRGLLTRALGVQPEVEVETQEVAVQAGDIFLLCSDGLSDMLEDRLIAEILGQGREALRTAALQLIQAANRHGGLDNISVILIRAGQSRAEPWLWRWFAGWGK